MNSFLLLNSSQPRALLGLKRFYRCVPSLLHRRDSSVLLSHTITKQDQTRSLLLKSTSHNDLIRLFNTTSSFYNKPFGGFPNNSSGGKSPRSSRDTLIVLLISGAILYTLLHVSGFDSDPNRKERFINAGLAQNNRSNNPADDFESVFSDTTQAPKAASGPSSSSTTNTSSPAPSQSSRGPITNPRQLMQTLRITWKDFNKQMADRNVNKIYANRRHGTVFIHLKKSVDHNGLRTINLVMDTNQEEIEQKVLDLQEELNYSPEERVEVVFVDNTKQIIATAFVFMFMMGLMMAMSRYINNIGRRIQSNSKQGKGGEESKSATSNSSSSSASSQQSNNFMSQFMPFKTTVAEPVVKTDLPKITFKDVAGLHEAKIEIKEFVDYLTNPDRFIKLGARVPKGALLLGPPGCGKTLLAKALANEANVPFFNMAGTEFIEIIGGVGAARVRELFEKARKQAPSIIYIDEIDAVGRKRSGDGGAGRSGEGGGSGEADQTLNQLLVSMDGLESDSNVIVIASTNRADILDKALLRPGRFDRHISIDLPTYLERIEILQVHMSKLSLNFSGKDKKEFVEQISYLTPRFSGADLANVCNEAALLAAREGSESIGKNHFHSAIERVLAGPEKKNTTISVEDRRIIAYHECGKILISWLHPNSDLILKVSMLSRTKSNAFSQYLPADRKLYSREELFDQMCLYFGGRVAESLVFNHTSTNSEQDLKKITKLAYAQVESFGMSDVIGNVSFPTQQEEAQTAGYIRPKPYSKKLRNMIDLEVNKLVAQAHKSANGTVQAHLDKLHALVDELLKKESLKYEDIVKLIGPPLNKERYSLAKTAQDTESVI